MKVSELQGAALDWAVAECEQFVEDEFEPSENWADGGPIIEREEISLETMAHDEYGDGWLATLVRGAVYMEFAPTPLIAAMRCYVASQMGDEVDVPDELMEGEVK
jgi:hypothetical protein